MQQLTSPKHTPHATMPPKELIDAVLRDYFAQQTAAARSISASYYQLWEAVAALSRAGGKRIRPRILLMSYQAYSKNSSALEPVLPAALATELLHIAMLIHDDIIDRDYVRYGQKNVAAQYTDTYGKFINGSELQHFSHSTALLAGDALLSQAHHVVQNCTVKPHLIERAHTDLSQSIFEVIGGELMDTESAFIPAESSSPLTIAHYKTASYSFIGPLVMGAHLAEAPANQVALLRIFGEKLGIAYQLQDDLLGVFGDESQTGKSTSSDIQEGKRTYLVERFNELADDDARKLFASLFGKTTHSDHELQTIRQLLIESGARDSIEDEIEARAIEARDILSQLTVDPAHVSLFERLITSSLKRSH